MLVWNAIHPEASPEMLGYLPQIFTDADPRPAREQVNDRYRHGGGWDPFEGFTMLPDGNLQYPGDPPTQLLVEAHLRNETIRFYEHAWVVIMQDDGSWEVCRMD